MKAKVLDLWLLLIFLIYLGSAIHSTCLSWIAPEKLIFDRLYTVLFWLIFAFGQLYILFDLALGGGRRGRWVAFLIQTGFASWFFISGLGQSVFNPHSSIIWNGLKIVFGLIMLIFSILIMAPSEIEKIKIVVDARDAAKKNKKILYEQMIFENRWLRRN